MKIKNKQDFFAGLMFIGIGLAFAWGASSYRLGVAVTMGPGYFPLMVSIILAIMGIAITCSALIFETNDGGKIGRWAWKAMFFVLCAPLVFGVLLCGLRVIKLPGMGLIVAIYALTIIAMLAAKGFKLRPSLILATVFAIFSYFMFIVVLKLSLPVWPNFIG